MNIFLLIPSYIGSFLILFVGPIFSLIARFILFSDGPANRINRFYAKLLFKLSQCTITITGEENIDPSSNYLVVSNHQSFFDIVVLFAFLKADFRFIVKKELAYVPGFGLALLAENDFLIYRNNSFKSYNTIQKAIQFLKTRGSIVVFPEGTRSREPKINPFKAGSLKLAINAQVPVLPVTLVGTLDFLKRGGIKINPVNVKLIISKPVETSAIDIKQLTSKVQSIIEEQYNGALKE